MPRTAKYKITAKGAAGEEGYSGSGYSFGTGRFGGSGLSVTQTIETTSENITCSYSTISGGSKGDTTYDGGKGGDGISVTVTDSGNELTDTLLIVAAGGGGAGAQEGNKNCNGGKAKNDESKTLTRTGHGDYVLYEGKNGIGKSELGRGGKSGGNGGTGDAHGGTNGEGWNEEGTGGTGGNGGSNKTYGGGGGGGGFRGGGGGGARNSFASGGGAGSSIIKQIGTRTITTHSENTTYFNIQMYHYGNEHWVTKTLDGENKIYFWEEAPTLADYTIQTIARNTKIYYSEFDNNCANDALYPDATFSYTILNRNDPLVYMDDEPNTEIPAPYYRASDGGHRAYFFQNPHSITFRRDRDKDHGYGNILRRYEVKYFATSDINMVSNRAKIIVFAGVSNYTGKSEIDFSKRYKRTENTNDNTVSNYLYNGDPLSNHFKVKSTITNSNTGSSGYKTTINNVEYDLDDVFEPAPEDPISGRQYDQDWVEGDIDGTNAPKWWLIFDPTKKRGLGHYIPDIFKTPFAGQI